MGASGEERDPSSLSQLIGVGRWSPRRSASVAAQGDAEAVMGRVDLPALTRSLSGQIAHAYLDQNPQFRNLPSVEQGLVGSIGAGASQALPREAHASSRSTARRRPPFGGVSAGDAV
jgi:hypothetical protein